MTKAINKTLIVIILYVVSFLTGCGSVQHKIDLKPSYIPQAGTTIQVGKVTNQTGQNFEVDAEKLLNDALVDKLQENKLLFSGGDGPKLLLNSKIVEYEQGNAFKRWLLPGWGSTILTVQCDLKDGENLVGSVDARRTVSVGGGYSIGAWRTIFGDLAGDITKEIKSKLGGSKK